MAVAAISTIVAKHTMKLLVLLSLALLGVVVAEPGYGYYGGYGHGGYGHGGYGYGHGFYGKREAEATAAAEPGYGYYGGYGGYGHGHGYGGYGHHGFYGK